MIDNECPKDHRKMNPQFTTHYCLNVASLVTGRGMVNSVDCVFDISTSIPINLLLEQLGIAAVDRLYPLKPKNPI